MEGLRLEYRTMIFFESPHRLINMLTDIYEIMGNRYIVLAKEITKMFEEIARKPVKEVLDSLKDIKIKGEYTIIVEGFREASRDAHLIDKQR